MGWRLRRCVTNVCAAAVLAGCGPGALPYMQSGAALNSLNGTGAGRIQHIVYIVQENRSFDNLFQGYSGADTMSSGRISTGERIKLQPASLGAYYVIDHSATAMFLACRGRGKLPGTQCRMDGFNNEQTIGGPRGVKYVQYVYAPHKETKPYF
ncbi:MAG: hypothetical protein JO104_11920, partial [Candidatus Eremiobacteraeota bacterium]|nr:hypothetical protein [Candidatus Eremiobacteraeota bacterium]